MNKYVYRSSFKDEMLGFIKLRRAQGLRYMCGTVLRCLDTYLAEHPVAEKKLSPDFVDSWIAESFSALNPNTVNGYMMDYIQFAKYLNTLNIEAYLPIPSPHRQSYTPYIFSGSEVEAIFRAADNIKPGNDSNADLWFPMLLRLLYGCGLRLAEALSLTFTDVDIAEGVLFIRNAKGNKDRFVPMDISLTEILKQYCVTILRYNHDIIRLFENSSGNKIGNSRARYWFRRTLRDAGIELLPGADDSQSRTRNICPNCFRHTFAVTSLHLQHGHSISNYRITPLLSTYLGHNKLAGTQKYLHMTSEIAEDIHDATTAYSKGLFPEVPL